MQARKSCGAHDRGVVGDVFRALDDVVTDRAGEQHGLLGDVADPAAQIGACELGDVGVIEQHAAGMRAVEPEHQLEERGLATAVAPEDDMDTARLKRQVDLVEHRRVDVQIVEAGVLDDDATLRPRQLDLAGLALAGEREDLAQPLDRRPRHGVGAPRAEELGERPEDAARQHVAGDQRADRQLLMHDGDGAGDGHHHRGYHRHGGAEIGVEVGLAAAHDGVLDGRGLRLLPQRRHRLVERQRLDDGARLRELGDHGVAPETDAALVGAELVEHRAGAPAEQHEDAHAEQQDPGDRHGDHEGDADEDQRERQVGGEERRRTRGGAAHHVDVAEHRGPVGRRPHLELAQRQRQQLAEQSARHLDVDLGRHALHQARAELAQQEVEGERDRHADRQAGERAHAGEEDDAVVHLQHEDRCRERQDVDEQRHPGELAEQRPQRLQERLEPGVAHHGGSSGIVTARGQIATSRNEAEKKGGTAQLSKMNVNPVRLTGPYNSGQRRRKLCVSAGRRRSAGSGCGARP